MGRVWQSLSWSRLARRLCDAYEWPPKATASRNTVTMTASLFRLLFPHMTSKCRQRSIKPDQTRL